jgi:alpha-mannosidase
MPNFESERRIESDQIRNRLREIEETIYSQRQPIGKLEACVTGTGRGPERAPDKGYDAFQVHDRWGGFDQTTWFRMTVKVPASMKGRAVVAIIQPGGESLAYVNGKPTQGLDRNHDAIHLTKRAKGGDAFEIALESVPSVRFDEYHNFECADIAVFHQDVWDFYWDCAVVFDVWKELALDYAPRRQLGELLNAAVKQVDLQHVGEPAYFDSVAKAQRFLGKGLKGFETSYGVGALTVMGQSHIDTAWLWPLRETERKCGRTFSTVLSLLDRYPDFIFTCSQPVQYEWMKKNYPEQYRRIKKYVKEGRWEPCGGAWVESDNNVPSGEAMVRQLLYGNRFYRKEFGMQSRSAWLPDSFGYTWALPQILRKAQIDRFYSIKITWNRFTEFPYSLFDWEGIDGTRITAIVPPVNYNGMMTPKEALVQWNGFKQKERIEEVPYPIGFGDGGGGPTPKMIETAMRLGNIVGMPKCTFGKAQDSFDRIAEQGGESLPVWNGELYLEMHRGCQTTQARTKRHNRKSEILMHDAELISSLALAHGGAYEQKKLEDAWKLVLLNQFHDILPGSSITEVYQDTERDYAIAREKGGAARDKALAYLAKTIDTAGDGRPVVVFNTLSWERDDVVTAKVKLPKGKVTVVDLDGMDVPHQKIGQGEILFEAASLPPLGHAVYRVVPGTSSAEPTGKLEASEQGMENDFLRIRFDKNGALSSIHDKVNRREVLPKGQRGNVLQCFDDRPSGNDAWDIDHNFEEIAWEPGPAESVEVVETGPVRAVVRMIRKTEKSTITQDVTMYASIARVDFVTHVDWNEKRVLLKVAFPVDVRASRATYEIQYGAVERPTHHNTEWDRARFEVPAHKWADLSEGDYGVSLLNDCKYGYDIKDNVMRLSLLRSPAEPDPHADEGEHDFTYSIYPHQWGWRNGVVEQGFQLNCPPIAHATKASAGTLPSEWSFAQVDADHVIVDAIKKHEDSDALIVRLFEAHGRRGNVRLAFGQPPKEVTECDLMEENDTPVNLKGSRVEFYVKPYEIRTFKVVF